MRPTVSIGKRHIDDRPAVVGTVSELATLSALADGTLVPECDVVELRADLVGTEAAAWCDDCKALNERVPVLLTARATAEGGAWAGPEADRLALYQSLWPAISAMDIELSSEQVRDYVAAAAASGVASIVSFHDFERTPTLQSLVTMVQSCIELGASIPKVATLARDETDAQVLRDLLAREWNAPLCVLAMGPLGPRSRVEFPGLGSCLTYGYLDRPVAPGQLHARDLTEQLRLHCPAYARGGR